MNETSLFTVEELLELLDQHKYATFRNRIDELLPIDAAELLAEIPTERMPVVYRILKKDTAAAIFAESDPETQTAIINGLTDREISSMLEELYTDDAVDMLEEMPANIVNRIMQSASSDMRREINRFLSYPEDSAGSVMTSEFIELRRHMTCAEAIERIRKIGLDSETVYVAYVTDSSRVLQGVVPLKQLLFTEPDRIIGDIMNENVIFAYTHEDRESVANTIARYDILALPVVDTEQRLVGLVTVDDALDVLEDEATEDIEMLAAMLPSDKEYMRTGVWETFKKRIPWLLLLMLTATFTGTIITHYEAAIGTYAILTAFIPMLTGTGGNAGGQSSVAVIRALSLGEIELRDALRVFWKEMRVAVICGIVLSAATFLKVMALDFGFRLTEISETGVQQNNLHLALIISATVFCAVLVAKAVGALLPIGAKRIGIDPAVMASPFITTVVDTLTLVIYFAITSAVLHF
jgi:magnesium transporter